MNKSTITDIKERFDKNVERFSNLDTGQLSTIDAKVIMVGFKFVAPRCLAG